MDNKNPNIPPQGPQDGAAKPNPAPPPPASAVTPESAAYKAYEEALKKTQESIEKTGQLIETEKQLRLASIEAQKKHEETIKKLTKEQENLEKAHKKYKDSQGNWMKGTEAIQETFGFAMEELQKKLEDSASKQQKANEAIEANQKLIDQEKKIREEANDTIWDSAMKIRSFDSEMSDDIMKDFNKSMVTAFEVNFEGSKKQKQIQEEAGKAAKEMAEGLRRANVMEMAEQAKKSIEIAEKKAQIDAKRQANDAMSAIGKGGGQIGMVDIKTVLDDLAKQIDEDFKTSNAGASEAEIEKNREEKLLLKRKEILQEITRTKEVELQKKQEERILGIMKDKGVGRDRAIAIDSPTQKKEAKILQQNMKDISDTLTNMSDDQLLQSAKADNDRIKEAERAAENRERTPPWAQSFIDGLDEVKELLDLMRFKEEGWWKIILIILATTVGAVLGYIWKYIQTITSIIRAVPKLLSAIPKLLTKLPYGIGKAIGQFFGRISTVFNTMLNKAMAPIKAIFSKITGTVSKISGFMKGILSKFSKIPGMGAITGGAKGAGGILAKFGSGLKSILSFFPKFTGFFGTLGKAFMFGFRVLGKVFFWVGLAVDVIMGMVKGFKEMPNIKGILMGAVAGIVSFFTFGLLDFKKTFDFINVVFGSIFDGIAMVFQPIIDFFSDAFGYIKDAFSKIMGIFSGEGSFIGKLFKSIGVLITLQIKLVLSWIVTLAKVAFAYFFKLPFMITKFIWESVFAGIELIAEGMVWLWDWITSGAILGDLMNFGTWIYDELVGFFADIFAAIGDGLGKIPWIGDYIKEFFGGTSASGNETTAVTKKIEEDTKKVAKAVEKTSKAATVKTTSGVGARGSQAVPIYKEDGSVAAYKTTGTPTGTRMQQAASTTAAAQREAAAPPAGNVAINAPATTVASMGGNQGGSPTLFPTKNRNTEPTYRALLFTENPAF